MTSSESTRAPTVYLAGGRPGVVGWLAFPLADPIMVLVITDVGDLTAASAFSTPNRTYAVAGTCTVKLATTNGWGRSSTATRTVVVG